MLEGVGENGLVGIKPGSDLDLGRAARCGAACGVSRVADLTFLDVLNLPVCQAVRPWSRALSVHQGKGLTRRDACLGALMEAVESCAAERFEGETRLCSFCDLPRDERAPAIEDFASGQGPALDSTAPRAWTPAHMLLNGARFWVPFECVSLDLTFPRNLGLERSSNGQASGFSVQQGDFIIAGELAADVGAIHLSISLHPEAAQLARPERAHAGAADHPHAGADQHQELLVSNGRIAVEQAIDQHRRAHVRLTEEIQAVAGSRRAAPDEWRAEGPVVREKGWPGEHHHTRIRRHAAAFPRRRALARKPLWPRLQTSRWADRRPQRCSPQCAAA